MYGIHRVEKRCRSDVYGLQVEANRTKKDHFEKGRELPGSDVDWSKTDENVFLVRCDNWNKKISEVLKEHNIKARKNSIVLLDSIYTASSEFFENKSKAQIVEYFKACLDFHVKTYGEYAINAVIHFDETKHSGNVHLHVASIPLIEKDNGSVALSARDLMGGRDDYRQRQDAFFEEVSSLFGLERGQVKDYSEVRKHINKMEYEVREANIKAQKAKAELRIRERVQEVCAERDEPIEILAQTKESKILNKPATVTVRASDFEKMQARISCSKDLKNGLAAMEKLAKETMDAAATDEIVLGMEEKLRQERAKRNSVERDNKNLQTVVNNQLDRLSSVEYERDQLNNILSVIKDWLMHNGIYEALVKHLREVDLEEKRERERERLRFKEIEEREK